MEDAIDAFKMIFDGGQYWLPCWLAVYTLSVSLCFYSGMTFTKIFDLKGEECLYFRDNHHQTALWHSPCCLCAGEGSCILILTNQAKIFLSRSVW